MKKDVAANEPVSLLGERLVGLPEVSRRLGVCARTIRRLVDKGQFPPPVSIPGCKGVRFLQSEVLSYLEKLRPSGAGE